MYITYIALLKEIAILTKETQENKLKYQNVQYNTQLQTQYDSLSVHSNQLEMELKAKLSNIHELNKKNDQLESLIKELQIAHKYKISELEQNIQKLQIEINNYKSQDSVIVQSVDIGIVCIHLDILLSILYFCKLYIHRTTIVRLSYSN